MAELTLLVNSTDTALLNGGAASPAIAGVTGTGKPDSGETAGGFASVLGQQFRPDKGVMARDSGPPVNAGSGESVTQSGELRLPDGKSLPPGELQTAMQGSESILPAADVALLTAIMQGNPAVSGQMNTPLAATTTTSAQSLLLSQNGVLASSTLPSSVMSRTLAENGLPTTLSSSNASSTAALNTAMAQSAIQMTDQKPLPVLPTAGVEAQRAASPQVIPAMLGQPVSTLVQQALSRASLNGDKVQASSVGKMDASNLASFNTQSSQYLSAAMNGTQNGLSNGMGNAMRLDMLAAAMGGNVQGESSNDIRLPASSIHTITPASLLTQGTATDEPFSISAGVSRLPGASMSGVPPLLAVNTPVGQHAWNTELSQRVTWMANNELREAQLQLNPRNLGAVDVRIVYGAEQQMSVSFSAANPLAREALDASLPRLREMFEQQGLQLADANISHEPPEQREQRNAPGAGVSTQGHDSVTNDGQLEIARLDQPSAWMGEGMLDTYA